jgi:hypothetical protein
MTAPKLKPPFEPASDPTVINSIPTTIIAKAMKNNRVANENDETTCGCASWELDFARQSEQAQREGSKQLLQTVRAHDWQTYVAGFLPQIWQSGAVILING